MIKKEVYSILNFLKKNGASAYVEEGKLKILAAKEILNRELSEKISLHREEIISFLISNISYSHIPLAPFLEGYPLSSSQRRLWILSRFEGADGAYNIPEVFRVSGEVDITSLKDSYFTLLSRHEILRTVFRENVEGEVFQYILTDVFEESFAHLILDFSKEEDIVSSMISSETSRIFDLSEGPLIRFTVFEDASGSGYIFCLVMHHIISDGWSMGILKKELFTLYHSFEEGHSAVLRPLTLQYKDYAFWEQSGLETNGLVSKAYWQEQLSGDLPVLNLPSQGVRPLVKTYNGAYLSGSVSLDVLSNLRDLSKHIGGTLFMTVLSAVKVLLYRYSGQSDLIIGTPVAGRDHADLHDQIGFYVNTLALRSHVDGGCRFVDYLLKVRDMTLSGYAHQSYPFDRLVDDLDLVRDMSRNPVFDVMVNFQDSGDIGEGSSVFSENSSFSSYTGSGYMVSKFDLDFNFSENDSDLGIGLCYNTDLYDRIFADRLVRSLELLLKSISESSETIIDELDILPQEEHYLLTEGFNQTKAAYPQDKTVIDLFESQVLLRPDNTALIFEGTELSYRELDERSNQFAHYLRGEYNIGRDDLVGIQLERSSDFVITILGILKSGGAYVPIDPSYPSDRIAYMKEDSGCKLVVDSDELLLFKDQQQRYSVLPVEHIIHPNDLVYVIYTSGSTGRPKGVMVEHGGVLNMALSQIREFGLVSSDIVFFFASIAFDASFSELMMSLLSGSSLFICEDDVLKDKNKFVEILKSSGTSVITLPPAYSEILSLDDLSGLRVLISAGESSSIEKGLSLCGSLSYFNAYGPTECSVCSSIYRLSEKDSWRKSIPIGYPISNTRMYILSAGGSLCPLGVVGEICISGAGLARGYLNNELLTKEKFVSNRYVPGERLYKTGDLGRWLSDGSIEYIGRKDNQVKIRGYRIELGEIELALQGHADVSGSVVVAVENNDGHKELAAYITGSTDLSIVSLRDYLGGLLPDYMVPGHYIQLDSFPLTSNGKLDRKSLPDAFLSSLGSGSEYVAARSTMESVLVGVYEDVLGKSGVGIRDDFFLLGGDSIKCIQIVSRLRQKGYSCEVKDILLNPMIEDLVVCVKALNNIIDQRSVVGDVLLSPIQMDFLTGNYSSKDHFYQSVLLKSRDSLDRVLLERALHSLLVHHDALRMDYRFEEGEWHQFNGDVSAVSVEILEFWVSDDESFSQACRRVQSCISIEGGVLLKGGLLRSDDGDYLYLSIHHLVVDGVSWRILFEDLASLYSGYEKGDGIVELPLKTDSYQHWSAKLHEYGERVSLSKERLYWDSVLDVPVSDIPVDYPLGSKKNRDTRIFSFSLDKENTHRLQTECFRAYKTSVNDILLGCLGYSLRSCFGLDGVCFKMEGHGRESIGTDVDISRTVGWFTSVYPLVISFSEGESLVDHLIRVKELIHRVPNKGIGYGILKHIKGLDYELRGDVLFNYLGDFGSGLQEEDGTSLFEFSRRLSGDDQSLDEDRDSVLEISGMIIGGELQLGISYSCCQYDLSTIERLSSFYETSLLDLIEVLSKEQAQYLTPVDLTYKGLSVPQVMALNVSGDLEDVYALAPLQQGLFYHWLSSPEDSVYFIQMSYRLSGDLDVGLLKESYVHLIDRYSVLRTVFSDELSDIGLQIVRKTGTADFNYVEVPFGSDPFTFIREYKLSDIVKGFDLLSQSPMRLSILKTGESEYEFIWSMHHILMDGWCLGILIGDLLHIYNALKQGLSPSLKPVHAYGSYLSWLENVDHEESLDYWRDYLSGYGGMSSIPMGVGIQEPGTIIEELDFTLDVSTSESLREVCIGLGVTENTFLQCLWGVLLGKYNGGLETDVVFGSVVSGRPGSLAGIEDMVGLFINTIPVRVRGSAETLFSEAVLRLHLESISSTGYHYSQLADIQNESGLGNGLFDHILIYENYPVQDMVGQEMNNASELRILDTHNVEQTNYDLTVVIVPGVNHSFKFSYNPGVYSKEIMCQLKGHLLHLVSVLVSNPDLPLSSLDIVTKEEHYLLTEGFNQTKAAYPQDKTVIDLFESQVLLTPENIALIFEGTELSYRELNDRSNQFAHYLRSEYNIGREDLVGVQLERSSDFVITILGILKSGGAYVPIDPSYPSDRIAYMKEDSGCKVVVDIEELLLFKMEMDDYSVLPVEHRSQPDDLVYVIYTSGSTGRPKGVMVEHGGALNMALSQIREFGLVSSDIVFFFASIAFDASFSELMMSLLSGSSLFICEDDVLKDKNKFVEILKSSGTSVITLPPAYSEILSLDDLSGLRVLISAGESSSIEKGLSLCGSLSYFNAYGPTECSVCSSIYRLSEKDSWRKSIPIGSPISNTRMYILSAGGSLCPLGVVGEICISGAGLARGYLNNELLTKEKFVSNQYVPGDRLYKTGDLGRWLSDGSIEYIGRKDNQVKIRGYRIELGEIELALQGHADVSGSVVLAVENNDGQKELAAYITGTRALSGSELRDYLRGTLPDYMVPGHYIQLDSFPLTSNGKLDRKSLPDAFGSSLGSGVEYVSARNETEEKLVFIWENVLGKSGIGIKDNFFELGGHSLKAIQMINSVRKEFNYKLPISVLYENQTIEYLSEAIIKVDNTSILVKMNTKGSKNPFFFVPTIIGDVFSFHTLSELLGKSQPFYGFQSPNLYLSKEKPSYSIPEIAGKIISEMQKIDPKGPYTLGGYSYGGLIVYEICTQLQNKGMKLNEVFFIDCKPPQKDKTVTQFEITDSIVSFCNMINFMNDSRGRTDLKININDLEKDTLDNQLLCLHEKLIDLGFLFSIEMLESYMYEYMRSVQNMIKYTPSYIKIDADIKLIKSFGDGHQTDNYGWEEFSYENKLTGIEVDCDHLELLNEKNILKYIHILKNNSNEYYSNRSK